jgi:hypothetical protein
MPKIGTLDFTGISGHKYTFNVYPISKELKEKEAVYVVTHRTVKADTSIDHNLIFAGATDNLKNEFNDHPKAGCFERESANCVCVYWEEHQGTREKIKEDLIGLYHPPCNDF